MLVINVCISQKMCAWVALLHRILPNFLPSMTIVGIGVDLLHVPRMAALIRRRGTNRIASRILSPLERNAFHQSLDERGSSPDAATVAQFLGVR